VNKIRKGDQVVVLSGRDKGRRGTVIQVLADGSVIVESVNMVKKHQRANPQAAKPKQGGIIDKEMPLAASKVAVFNPATKKPDRIGFKRLADGKKVRFFKSNGEMLEA
jgi:large subunit ribosomal protein L24